MIYKINHDKKIISIFLANGESPPPNLLSCLPIKADENYSLAVFYSGKEDLAKITGELLKHNL